MATSGEISLPLLLSTLSLTLHPQVYVFMTFKRSAEPPPPTLLTLMSFREPEGLTVITTLDSAQAHGDGECQYTFPCRMITCNVHSSLEAVGFMPKLTGVLAQKGIGCNPVSAFFHDHLFVSQSRAQEALTALEGVAAEANAELASQS